VPIFKCLSQSTAFYLGGIILRLSRFSPTFESQLLWFSRKKSANVKVFSLTTISIDRFINCSYNLNQVL
jgi:hypothetical protein